MDVVLGLGSSGAHYIFISTDSVYMCCLGPGGAAEGLVREEQACRPADEGQRVRLHERDPYQSIYGWFAILDICDLPLSLSA